MHLYVEYWCSLCFFQAMISSSSLVRSIYLTLNHRGFNIKHIKLFLCIKFSFLCLVLFNVKNWWSCVLFTHGFKVAPSLLPSLSLKLAGMFELNNLHSHLWLGNCAVLCHCTGTRRSGTFSKRCVSIHRFSYSSPGSQLKVMLWEAIVWDNQYFAILSQLPYIAPLGALNGWHALHLVISVWVRMCEQEVWNKQQPPH